MSQFQRAIVRGRMSGSALVLCIALAGSLLSCARKVQKFSLSVVISQDLHLKAGSPLDSGLKSILSYYDVAECPEVLYVPAVSLVRMDSNAGKPVELPLFLSASDRWKVNLGLPLTEYTLKHSYDSEVPDLKTFDILTTQLNQTTDSEAARNQFPDALELTIKNGATNPEAVKQSRKQIGSGLCKGKQAFSVILAPPPAPPPAPEPPAPEPPALKPMPVIPAMKPTPVIPSPKPTPIVRTAVSSSGPIAKATTPSARFPKLPVITSRLPDRLPTPSPTPARPPVPITPAVKPCYTVQVFSIYKERLEDNPIQDGSSFAIDDPDKGLLTKGNLSAKAKPCASVPPHMEVRLRWTRDGRDQANPPLEPSEADGTEARALQNHPLPGKYEVRVFVGGIEATAAPFRFTILPRGSSGAGDASGAAAAGESSAAKESK